MNKETEQEYLAKKVPALRTTHYEKVTVDVPDKFGIVRAAQEFLAALHFADMQDLDDNQEQVATNVNVQSAWVDLQMAYEGLVEDMGDKPKSTTTEQVVNDPLGLYDATGKLYKAIESKDLEVALSHVKYIEEIARTYADLGSAAHDPFNLLELTEKLNSAIDAEDKSQANDVLAELAEKVQDGMKRAKADREFNENN
ncbi:hypothetical protein [Weissella confusa]|uniref:hypothetical protein n=1 Tax=Weissella confusa TaxID=1583 RepID=UPI00223A9028|nr:hypothetical protein [Weissella confusa]MCT0023948.1 hypothetical protein [Weissella confusa]